LRGAERACLDPVPIYALFPQRAFLPPKVRVFVDYLVDLFAGRRRVR
jgi:DNA-binding transcriptional LysR family regulator